MQLRFVVRRWVCSARQMLILLLFLLLYFVKLSDNSSVDIFREKHLGWCFLKPSDVSAVVAVLTIRILEQWDRIGCEWIIKYAVMSSIQCLTMEILRLCEWRALWNCPPPHPRGDHRSLICGWSSSWSGLISSRYSSSPFTEVEVNSKKGTDMLLGLFYVWSLCCRL